MPGYGERANRVAVAGAVEEALHAAVLHACPVALPHEEVLDGLVHVEALDAVPDHAVAEAHALVLRYASLAAAPIDPETLLKARRPEDEGTDLWRTMNRLQENLIHGGVSDFHRDRRGKLRSVRALRGIDSKVTLNKGLWSVAERLANGEPLPPPESVALTA